MRPFRVLSKLKLDSFIQSESFAIKIINEFLARDTPSGGGGGNPPGGNPPFNVSLRALSLFG